MQLPEQLQRFPHGALIVAADHVHARFLLVGGDAAEELDGVAMPREREQDHEGQFVSSDGARTAQADQSHVENDRQVHFVKLVAETTAKLAAAHDIHHIHLLMPAELDHAVTAELPPATAGFVGFRVHADVMGEMPLQWIERLFP